MSVENRLLSKVINEQSLKEIKQFNVTENDFYLQRETFLFINQYVKEYSHLPSYSEVVRECPDFEYEAEVTDNIIYLIKKLKSDNARRKSYELLQKQAGAKFNELNGLDFINWLHEEVSTIKAVSDCGITSSTNFSTNGAERLDMYLKSKENKDAEYIPTPFPKLTGYLGGGFECGDYVLFQGISNAGKSWMSSAIALSAWKNNFGVIYYSPELSKKQQLQRFDTLNSHFKNSELKMGELKNEEEYISYLETFNETNDVPLLIKTMSDLTNGLSLETIEADLQMNENIRMVVIDGFNLMTHERGDGNRNKMTNTSRKLRQLFAKYNVVGVVVHQLPLRDSTREKNDDDGLRIPNPPGIDVYSETSAVVQDACTILNFDAVDGVGKILLAKARTPHVNESIELHVNFNEGYIYETSPIDYI